VNNGTYQVHASRGQEPGQVEVHVKDVDIIYMLEGTTTFVTGGTMVGGKTTAPDEIRGSCVNGGETRTLTKGDVIIVPNFPHPQAGWYASRLYPRGRVMSLIPQAALPDSFPPYEAFRQNFGFVPAIFRAQSLLPRVIEAEAQIAGAVLLSPGALTRFRRKPSC